MITCILGIIVHFIELLVTFRLIFGKGGFGINIYSIVFFAIFAFINIIGIILIIDGLRKEDENEAGMGISLIWWPLWLVFGESLTYNPEFRTKSQLINDIKFGSDTVKDLASIELLKRDK